MASILMGEGRNDEALAEMDRVSSGQAGRPFPALLKGQIHVNRKDWPAARDRFQQALEIDANSPRAHL